MVCKGMDMSGIPVNRLTGTVPNVPKVETSGPDTLNTGFIWPYVATNRLNIINMKQKNRCIGLFYFFVNFSVNTIPLYEMYTMYCPCGNPI